VLNLNQTPLEVAVAENGSFAYGSISHNPIQSNPIHFISGTWLSLTSIPETKSINSKDCKRKYSYFCEDQNPVANSENHINRLSCFSCLCTNSSSV